MNKLLLLLYVLIASSPLFAQEFEGVITYKITYNSEEDSKENTSQTSEQKIYVKQSKSRFEQKTKMATITVLLDLESDYSTVLMETGGQKYMFSVDSTEMRLRSVKKRNDYKITFTGNTKEVAGYKCKEALIEFLNDSDGKAKVYFTDRIAARRIHGMEGLKLPGMPLEFIISSNNIDMTIKAYSVVEQSIPDSIFKIPEGYIEMPETLEAALKKKY